MKNNTKPQIFISFSTKDKILCETFIKKLDTKHFNFWYQEEINIGDEYKELIKEKIDSSIASILLLSNNFLSSKFIQEEELPWIVDKDKDSLIYEIIPIQIESCNWESINLLSGIQIYPSRSNSINLESVKDINNINNHIFKYLNNAGYIKKKGWFR